MRTSVLLAALGLVCVPLLGAAPAHAQATRTWVSGVGDDANPCSRTAPCKTFAGAISKTAVNGEINCLDPAGYGAVTITKSITIDCEDTQGSILAAGTSGVIINITAATDTQKRVLLRGISINGAGTGLNGINFLAGSSLTLDKMVVQNFNTSSAVGVLFQPNTTGAALLVNESLIVGNGIAPLTGGGIVVQPAVGGNAGATIAHSRIERNSEGVKAASTNGTVALTVSGSTLASNFGNGVNATAGQALLAIVKDNAIANNGGTGVFSNGANAFVRIGASSISGNANGVLSAGGGALRSYKDNNINGNAVDGTPILQENFQ